MGILLNRHVFSLVHWGNCQHSKPKLMFRKDRGSGGPGRANTTFENHNLAKNRLDICRLQLTNYLNLLVPTNFYLTHYQLHQLKLPTLFYKKKGNGKREMGGEKPPDKSG